MCCTGRRVLSAYMHAFLASLPYSQRSNLNAEELAAKVLNTYSLGEFVAADWQLGRVVRWTPPEAGLEAHREPGDSFDDRRRHQVGEDGKRVWRGTAGYYKVTGTTVEAIIGGIFHEHVSITCAHIVFVELTFITCHSQGGTAARHVFHTQVLPRLLVPNKRVPENIMRQVNELSVKMGGKPRPRETEGTEPSDPLKL
jgi:hypothetical protein